MEWFKIFPASYLNVIKRIPDGVHRAAFSLLVFHCWADGSLPDSDDDISYDTGLPVEIIAQLRPHLKRLARSEDGRLFINIVEETIRERKEFSEKKAQAGKAGGTQKEANKRLVKQVLANPSSASHRQPVVNAPSLRLAEPSHSCIHADNTFNNLTTTEGEEKSKPNPAPPPVNPVNPVTTVTTVSEEEARLNEIEGLLIHLCGITYISPPIERQLTAAVAAFSQTKEPIARIKEFCDSRTKVQALNYVAQNFMQWVGNANREQSQQPAKSKTYCGACVRGWVMPTTGDRTATRCQCVNQGKEQEVMA